MVARNRTASAFLLFHTDFKLLLSQLTRQTDITPSSHQFYSIGRNYHFHYRNIVISHIYGEKFLAVLNTYSLFCWPGYKRDCYHILKMCLKIHAKSIFNDLENYNHYHIKKFLYYEFQKAKVFILFPQKALIHIIRQDALYIHLAYKV